MLYLNHKEQEINIPTRWEDLTWGQRKSMPENSGENREAWVSYFTGIENAMMRLSMAEFMRVAEALSFLSEPANLDMSEFSGMFHHEGESYFIDPNVGTIPAGIYLDIFREAQKYAQPEADQQAITEAITKLVIEYTIKGEDYDYGQAMMRDINGMGYVEVESVAAFFLLALTASKNGTAQPSRTEDIQPKKTKPVIRRLLSGLGFS